MSIDIRKSQYLTVNGILFSDNRLLLQPGYLTERSEHSVEDPRSPLIAELVDDQKAVLLRFQVPVAPFCADSAKIAEFAVTGKIPFLSNTRAVRFYHHNVLIHELEVPRGRPKVQFTWEPTKIVEGSHVLSWQGDHPEGRSIHYMTSYSHTDGRSWQPLSLSMEETSQEVDFDQLPGGDHCKVGVLATDGVNTILTESKPFVVPIKQCRAMILAPADGSSFAIDEVLFFQGQGYYLEEQRAETEQLIWTSSQNGELGRGMVIEVKRLSPGFHLITLRAGKGQRAGEARISIGISGEIQQEWVLS